MTTIQNQIAAMAGLLALGAGGARAQATRVPIPEEPSTAPQIQIDGAAIGTLSYTNTKRADGGSRSDGNIDISDTSLTIGAAQRLYRGGAVGSMTIGFTATGHDAAGADANTGLFVHQAFADFQNRTTEAFIGRTSLPSHLVEFPTIREDDLMGLTELSNPFSKGDPDEEHYYGNVAGVTLNRGLRQFVTLYGQHLLNSGEDAGGNGINSGGVTLQYLAPPGLEGLERVAQWGVGYEHRAVPGRHGGASNAIHASGVVNIVPSAVRRLDLRLFGATTFGNDTGALADATDAFRADSTTVSAALRLLNTPFGHPASQVSLTAGYRHFRKVDDADMFGVALTGVKRMGAGFDVVTQYSWQRRDKALAEVMGGRNEHRVEVGLVFNFQNTINKHLGPRRTLLNMRHQYIPE